MYLVWINPPINFTFSDDSVFLKKILAGDIHSLNLLVSINVRVRIRESVRLSQTLPKLSPLSPAESNLKLLVFQTSFMPNVFSGLSYRPDELRAFLDYYEVVMAERGTVGWTFWCN